MPEVNRNSKPTLSGCTDDEAGLFHILQKAGRGKGLGRVQRYLMNMVFTCPSGFMAEERIAHSVPAYRYRYFGVYPNTHLDPDVGAYHAAEIAVLFGTSESYSGIKDSDAEAETGKLMRKAWSAFAKDPENGLTSELGWPRYDPQGNHTRLHLKMPCS